MSSAKSKIKLSPIQAEIIFTLADLHNNSGCYDDGSRTLASIIFGHFSHSSTITKAVNGIVKKSGDLLISNKAMPYLNIKSLNELGIRTTSSKELWKDLINHPDIAVEGNRYVVYVRRDSIYRSFTFLPSYLMSDGAYNPTFGSLSNALTYSFRQDAAKQLKQALHKTHFFNDELLQKASGIKMFGISTVKEEESRPPKIFDRATTPHFLRLNCNREKK